MRQKRRFLHFILVFIMISGTIGHIVTVTNISAKTSVTTITTQKEFTQCLYRKLLGKEKKFILKYQGDWNDLKVNNLDVVLGKIWAIDSPSTSDDFDYLKENIERYSMKISSNGTTSHFTFCINYRETKAQTAKVNSRIKKVLQSMKLDDMSDYDKIKGIHDYIINHVSYDQEYTNYTAYNALYDKTSVCQGYALLFYKMATEAGIPCRIVASKDHEWNIVQLGEKWYHVDTTWDDPISKKPVLRYNYFLKGSKAMARTHKLASSFTTKKFNKLYPVSIQDYKL